MMHIVGSVKIIGCVSMIAYTLTQVSAVDSFTWLYPYNSLYGNGTWYGTAPACAANSGSCTDNGLIYWFSTTQGNSPNCCDLGGKKVYCNTFNSPFNSIDWYGTAPICGASCGDCGTSSACVAYSGCGDGSACTLGGDKYMCATFATSQLEFKMQVSLYEYDYDNGINSLSILLSKEMLLLSNKNVDEAADVKNSFSCEVNNHDNKSNFAVLPNVVLDCIFIFDPLSLKYNDRIVKYLQDGDVFAMDLKQKVSYLKQVKIIEWV